MTPSQPKGQTFVQSPYPPPNPFDDFRNRFVSLITNAGWYGWKMDAWFEPHAPHIMTVVATCLHGETVDYQLSHAVFASPSTDGKMIAEATFQQMRNRCAMHGPPPATPIYTYTSIEPFAYQLKTTNELMDAKKYEELLALTNQQLLQQYTQDWPGYSSKKVTPAVITKKKLYGKKLNSSSPAAPPVPSVLTTMSRLVPGLRTSAKCPTRCEERYTGALSGMIIHLNDQHHWTREKIADWLDALEGIDLTVKPLDKTSDKKKEVTTNAKPSSGALGFVWTEEQYATYVGFLADGQFDPNEPF